MIPATTAVNTITRLSSLNKFIGSTLIVAKGISFRHNVFMCYNACDSIDVGIISEFSPFISLLRVR